MESEGLVDVVFPDDALGVVVLEPSFPDIGPLDLHHAIEASVIELIKILGKYSNYLVFSTVNSFGIYEHAPVLFIVVLS